MANPKVEDKYFTRYQTGKTREGFFTPYSYLEARRSEREEQQKMRIFDKAVGGDIDSFLDLGINDKLLVLFQKFELLSKTSNSAAEK
jgi:hypothetical protein